MAKQRLVTIHGIDSTGAWQEAIRPVFDPHFTYVAIKYNTYRPLGWLKLAFEPLVLLLGGLTCVALAILGVVRGVGFLASAALVVIAAYGGALVRRRTTVRLIKAKLDAATGAGLPPSAHLIAHSFGTFLSMRTLEKFPNVRFDRVILSGCVLPVRFDWQSLLSAKPGAVSAVWNEVGRHDWVVWLANQARRLIAGLGHAGLVGFEGVPQLIHRVDEPSRACQACVVGPPAVIHNVVIQRFDHNDAFVGRGHAISFWLPFLWGIPPREYREFLEQCTLAARYHDEQDLVRLRVVEGVFRQREWSWAGQTLEAAITLEIVERTPAGKAGALPEPALVDDAVGQVWRLVDRAIQALDMVNPDPAVVRALNPVIAIVRAAEAVTS
jgi:pimeloyl-ACP methyl ester carboxylesterase